MNDLLITIIIILLIIVALIIAINTYDKRGSRSPGVSPSPGVSTESFESSTSMSASPIESEPDMPSEEQMEQLRQLAYSSGLKKSTSDLLQELTQLCDKTKTNRTTENLTELNAKFAEISREENIPLQHAESIYYTCGYFIARLREKLNMA